LRLDGAKDGVEQTWEAGIEVVAPECVVPPGALVAGSGDPGFPEDLEVVAGRRFGDRQRHPPASDCAIGIIEDAHDLQPHRIRERVQHLG
jgi:hypothetical protein